MAVRQRPNLTPDEANGVRAPRVQRDHARCSLATRRRGKTRAHDEAAARNDTVGRRGPRRCMPSQPHSEHRAVVQDDAGCGCAPAPCRSRAWTWARPATATRSLQSLRPDAIGSPGRLGSSSTSSLHRRGRRACRRCLGKDSGGGSTRHSFDRRAARGPPQSASANAPALGAQRAQYWCRRRREGRLEALDRDGRRPYRGRCLAEGKCITRK